jgi:hypothetical protein
LLDIHVAWPSSVVDEKYVPSSHSRSKFFVASGDNIVLKWNLITLLFSAEELGSVDDANPRELSSGLNSRCVVILWLAHPV